MAIRISGDTMSRVGFLVVRRRNEDGKEWMDMHSLRLLPEIAVSVAKFSDIETPTFAAENPIVRVAMVVVKEINGKSISPDIF